ncbi:MAG TPA: FMN-binding protein [Acidothermaceae bacterium]
MKRAVLSTLGTVTAIVVLLGFKSAPVRVARPAFVSPLSSNEPPVLGSPATSPNVASGAASSAATSIASDSPTTGPASSTTQPAAPTTRAGATHAPSTAPNKTPTQVPTKAPTRSAAPPTKAASGTFLGASVQTRYGPVQIKITYAGGRVTGVVAVQLPSGRSRDAEINNYAVPILESETLAAQGANINSVSGATYTSDGYVQSLQSALDAAHR